MFNSVEFVLLFLSVFSSVTKESVHCVGTLLAFAIEYSIGKSIDCHKYQLTTSSIESLVALAESYGYDMKINEKINEEEVYELLCVILMPILGKLSLEELEEISKTGSSGSDVLNLPLDDVTILVKMWTQHAREDEEKCGRFEALPTLGSVEHTSAGGLIATSDISAVGGFGPEHMPEKAVKHGIDKDPKSEKSEKWPKMKMDAKAAAIILDYCNEHAAVSTKATLRRNERVKKRQIIPSNVARRGMAMEERDMWEMINEVSTKERLFDSSSIYTARSNELLSERTQLFFATPRHGSGVRLDEDENNWSDDGMECEWSMVIQQGQGSNPPLEETHSMDMRQWQGGPIFGSPTMPGARYNRPSPMDVSRATRAGVSMNVDDMFGVGSQNTNRPLESAQMSDYDPSGLTMPSTPLKHDRGGFDSELWGETSGMVLEHSRGEFDYGLWSRYSTGSLDEASNQAGPSGHSGLAMEMPGLGPDIITGPPGHATCGKLNYGVWTGFSTRSLNDTSLQGTSTFTPPMAVPNPSQTNMPSRRFDMFDPEYQHENSSHGPATTNDHDARNIMLPTPPMRRYYGFDYERWGCRSTGSPYAVSNQAGLFGHSGLAAETHGPNSNLGPGLSMPFYTMANHDIGNTTTPKAPLKHDRGEFGYELRDVPSARNPNETRYTYRYLNQPMPYARTPRTPINRNRGTVFDYELWARRVGIIATVNKTDYQEQETDSGPGLEMPRLSSNAPFGIPIRTLQVLRRKMGVRNLRVAGAIRMAMNNGGMAATTSMLNNVLIAQHERDNLRDSMTKAKITKKRKALPPLVGYYERSREYRERNGESNTSRTDSDSSSLPTPSLTPGTTPSLTSRTSPCPTLTKEYYAGVAAGWEALQKMKWEIGLQTEEQWTMDKVEVEVKAEVEPAWNTVTKAAKAIGRALRSLLGN
ncbi:hypothetical protein FRC12_005349 [Ceratobasidium sp. 428]|nr:hypothetical protein FRC12_005349 [Ceratobasidium sp. 428]